MYHSILTLVLLIWACLIWVLPKSRSWCLNMSPLYVFYSVCLLLLEFIYGLRLNSTELPEYKEVGLVKHEIPFIHLSIKSALLLLLWLTLKQYVTERQEKSQQQQQFQTGSSDAQSINARSVSVKTTLQTQTIDWIYAKLVKYWIFLSTLTLLFMSCQNEVVAYRIVYMILFLYFITTFQIFNKFWRASLYIFHLIVIIYSMIVLLLLYVFQFDEVPMKFKQIFHLDDLTLESIGFQKFDSKDDLIIRLLTPTTFLIVNILQIHYFNEPWLKLTDNSRIQLAQSGNERNEEIVINSTHAVRTPNMVSHTAPKKVKREKFSAFLKRQLYNLNEIYVNTSVYVWKFIEIHVIKMVLLIIAFICINQINLINFLLFTSILINMFVSKTSHNENKTLSVFYGFVQIWTSLFTITTMIYQLKFIESPFVSNCTFSNNSQVDPYLLKNQDNLVYIGVLKSSDILVNLKYYIIIFSILTFRKLVKLKMKHFRLQNNLPEPVYKVIFENITWREMDNDILSFVKYLFNYTFYKLGLEICLFMTTITIIVRMDAYAILYGVWLGLFLRLKRTTIIKMWPIYFSFLLLVLFIQYIMCLGLPPILCYLYPWSKNNQIDVLNLLNKVRVWLFLPDYSDPPKHYYMIADFFQLFFVWLQYTVFNLETSQNKSISMEDLGGNNNEIVYEREPYKNNPYHDFVSEFRSKLDLIKYGIYMYSYWLVLAMVYLTGTSRINILCMGYVILSFFFLWYGQTFLMKPLDKLLKHWNVIVFYCFMVIFIKACLQIVLCLLTNDLSENTICILVDIFGINCRTLPKTNNLPKSACSKGGEADDIGLVWDAICFLVLMLQRRLYMSYMFEHVVNEYKAQSTLAARGAEIFKEIIQHKVQLEKDKENKILEKLRANVERIRQHQSKSSSHQPEEHYEAVRSGDYYMFNSEFEIEETDIEELENEKFKLRKKNKNRRKVTIEIGDGIVDDEDSETQGELKQTDAQEPNMNIASALAAGLPIVRKTDLLAGNDPQSTPDNRQSWLTIENKNVLMANSFARKYFLIFVDYVIEYLNKHSKDFRHVSHILAKEKLILKRDYGNTQTPSLMALLSIELNKNLSKRTDTTASSFHRLLSEKDDLNMIMRTSNEVDQEMNAQTRTNKFLTSVFYFMLSQSEIICYFFMILNHLYSASLLSVALPISVFLWAMLCIPRPTKTFWITSITYIEAMVVIKYLFQFKVFPWNEVNTVSDQTLNKAISILGIEKRDSNFAVFDLLCLLVIFLHRTILKVIFLFDLFLN